MFTAALHFPIWQGAGAKYGYAHGADHLMRYAAQYLPLVTVPVDVHDFSTMKGGVKAVQTLIRHFEWAQTALSHMTGPLLTLGGDCVADYLSIAHAHQRFGRSMALLWIDAHGDINTPMTSPSGNFHGMLVRALLGEGPTELTHFVPRFLQPDQVGYVGLRDPDVGELAYINAHNIPRLSVDDVHAGRWQPYFNALKAKGFTHLYLHVDADVLDLMDFPSAAVAVPHGVRLKALRAFLQAARSQFELAGAALTEYSLPAPSQTDAFDDVATEILGKGFGLAR